MCDLNLDRCRVAGQAAGAVALSVGMAALHKDPLDVAGKPDNPSDDMNLVNAALVVAVGRVVR